MRFRYIPLLLLFGSCALFSLVSCSSQEAEERPYYPPIRPADMLRESIVIYDPIRLVETRNYGTTTIASIYTFDDGSHEFQTVDVDMTLGIKKYDIVITEAFLYRMQRTPKGQMLIPPRKILGKARRPADKRLMPPREEIDEFFENIGPDFLPITLPPSVDTNPPAR